MIVDKTIAFWNVVKNFFRKVLDDIGIVVDKAEIIVSDAVDKVKEVYNVVVDKVSELYDAFLVKVQCL